MFGFNKQPNPASIYIYMGMFRCEEFDQEVIRKSLKTYEIQSNANVKYQFNYRQ